MMTAVACTTCGAWIYKLRHHSTEKPAPINAEPDPKGRIAIDLEAGTYRFVPLAECNVPLHTNHYATCGNPTPFRRIKK